MNAYEAFRNRLQELDLEPNLPVLHAVINEGNVHILVTVNGKRVEGLAASYAPFGSLLSDLKQLHKFNSKDESNL